MARIFLDSNIYKLILRFKRLIFEKINFNKLIHTSVSEIIMQAKWK